MEGDAPVTRARDGGSAEARPDGQAASLPAVAALHRHVRRLGLGARCRDHNAGDLNELRDEAGLYEQENQKHELEKKWGARRTLSVRNWFTVALDRSVI